MCNHENEQGRVHQLVEGERLPLVGEHPEPVPPAHRKARREERQDERREEPPGPADELQAEGFQGGHGLTPQASAAAAAFNTAVRRQTAGKPRSGTKSELTRRAPRAAPANCAPTRAASRKVATRMQPWPMDSDPAPASRAPLARSTRGTAAGRAAIARPRSASPRTGATRGAARTAAQAPDARPAMKPVTTSPTCRET